MKGIICILCLAFWASVIWGVALVAPGCVTTTTTLPDGTVVTNTSIDWIRVQEAAQELSPYVIAAIDAAQDWQAAEEAQDAADTAAERAWRDRQVAFVAGSMEFVRSFASSTQAGHDARSAALMAIAQADTVIALLGVDETYLTLAREMVRGPADLDLPSDGELALQILRDNLADLLAQKPGT